MAERGPKRTVNYAGRYGRKQQWFLRLDECGHTVTRPVKTRNLKLSDMNVTDPAPSWVYCEACKEEA